MLSQEPTTVTTTTSVGAVRDVADWAVKSAGTQPSFYPLLLVAVLLCVIGGFGFFFRNLSTENNRVFFGCHFDELARVNSRSERAQSTGDHAQILDAFKNGDFHDAFLSCRESRQCFRQCFAHQFKTLVAQRLRFFKLFPLEKRMDITVKNPEFFISAYL